MVNSEAFAKRLEKIIDYYEFSAASFADKIQVGRSSISHILSGRNKPSLDFVLKIVSAFPEVELYWLLNGKGSFPKNAVPSPPEKTSTENTLDFSEKNKKEDEESVNLVHQTSEKKEIKKVIIFYTDGSFEAFEN
ncbi:helix-turn-helix domain-containing protein [Mesonia maritima]|uniref:Transcriptional regulator with XRE-family HTH domain n=1 Tax=Mesonia maritima TaxID=1793873 RepID=A0ABU1KCF5_9FLAO|nr:helix-turn-helix transcriptional regulator [Mesonia maritima]MDR6302147.1 transcriptional regulator with XRE-family HTH domain [Mesonia maritima]